MNIKITPNSNLPNQHGNGSVNPRELHPFEFQMLHTVIPEASENMLEMKWTLNGTYPKGIDIDANTGLISGTINLYSEQPSLTDKRPLQRTREDGTNWLNNGRPTGQTYTFTFDVTIDYTYEDIVMLDEMGNPSTHSGRSSSTVNIITVRDNDIDNAEFVKNYLASGKGRSLNYDDVEYTFDNWVEFTKNHPGPFCLR